MVIYLKEQGWSFGTTSGKLGISRAGAWKLWKETAVAKIAARFLRKISFRGETALRFPVRTQFWACAL